MLTATAIASGSLTFGVPTGHGHGLTCGAAKAQYSRVSCIALIAAVFRDLNKSAHCLSKRQCLVEDRFVYVRERIRMTVV